MQVELDFDGANYNPNVRGIFGANVQYPNNYNNNPGNNPGNNPEQGDNRVNIERAKTYLNSQLQCDVGTLRTLVDLGLQLVRALEDKYRSIDICEQEMREKNEEINTERNKHAQEKAWLQQQLIAANNLIEQREREYAQSLANTNISDMTARISSLQEEKRKLEEQNKWLKSMLGENGEDIMITMRNLKDDNEKLKKNKH